MTDKKFEIKHLKENNTTYSAHWWRAMSMSVVLFIHAWIPSLLPTYASDKMNQNHDWLHLFLFLKRWLNLCEHVFFETKIEHIFINLTNISKKIFIGGLIIILIAVFSSTVFIFLISDHVMQTAINDAKKYNALYLTSIVTNELSIKDFEPQNFNDKKLKFENYFMNIKNNETLRIKVWAKDGTIIYSDGGTLVGNNFVENPRFQNSINGQLVSEIKDPVDSENIDELGYGQLMEIYVPIYLNQLEPVGVIELYFSMNSINNSVNQINDIIFTIVIILIGLISLSVIIFSIIVSRLSQQSIVNERFASIGELSSKLSHDIRNPLSILYNDFELLKYKKIIDKKQIKRIDSALKRISHQIDDVLDYVRITPLHYSQVNLSKIIHNSLNTIIIPSEIKINITSDEILMEADEQKLEIVFINLILNAVQAIPNSGTIDIILSETKKDIIIEIKDSGEGIPEDVIGKIFDPLVTTKQKGTGLGLASVKSIIEQHNGRISVKNNPTIFTIKIPKKEKLIA